MWYYKVGDTEVGPVTAAQLRQKALRSEIRPETHVRQGTEGGWVRADAVQGLFGPPAPPRTRPVPPPLPGAATRRWLMPVAAVALVLLGMVLGLAVVRWSYRGRAREPVTETEPGAGAKTASGTATQTGAATVRERTLAGAKHSPADGKPGQARDVEKPQPEPAKRIPAKVSQRPVEPVGQPPGPPASKPKQVPTAKPPEPAQPPEQPKPPVGKAEPARVGTAVPGKPKDAPSQERPDPRIERFRTIYEAVLPLFEKWRQLEDEVAPLRAQLAPVVALCTQLEQRHLQLQREFGILQDAYRAARNDPDQADTASDLVLRINNTQQQISTVVASLGQARAERASLEGKIRELAGNQSQLTAAADQQSRPWISLSDPFGRLGEKSHRQVVELMTGWIGQQPELALPYVARAFSFLRLGEHDRAAADFEAAARRDPRLAALCAAARGYVLCRQGDQRRGGAEFGKASKLDPKLGIVHVFRGQAYIDQEKYSQAERELRLALRTGNDVAEAHEAMALLLAACPHESVCDGKKAVEHATRACELVGWENWSYLSTLAAAYAQAGQFDRAVQWATKAIDLAPAENRGELQKRLSLYQAAKPYRLK